MNLAKQLEKHWKAIVGVFAVLVVAGAVAALASMQAAQKEKAAQESYFAVEKKLLDLKTKKNEPPGKDAKDKKDEPPPDFTQVKKDLEKLIVDYPGSVAAQMAGLNLASLLVEDKNVDQALSTLQKVENKNHGLVNTLVQQQIGQLLADQQKCQEAIAVWQKILDRRESAFIHNETKIQQALCYSKINDSKKAEEILTNLANQGDHLESGGAATAKEAEKYLRLIQFKKASGG